MGRDSEAAGEREAQAGTASREAPWLRCARCDAPVVEPRARVTVGGAHVHERMNPAGVRFRVACFASAPGCRPDGERETVWSWFPPMAWQVELCRACGVHLGWSFHGDEGEVFWGLVEDRVR